MANKGLHTFEVKVKEETLTKIMNDAETYGYKDFQGFFDFLLINHFATDKEVKAIMDYLESNGIGIYINV